MSKLVLREVAKQRADLDSWELKRASELQFPEGIVEEREIPYLKDEEAAHHMDVYYPQNHEKPLPVIINVHGGGLLMGRKSINRHFCAYLASKGFLVFCAEYRLVPEVRVFHQFRDVTAAMNRVEQLLLTYGGDSEHIYMTGDSAGAYLIVYVTAMQKSPELAKAAQVHPSSLPVKALGLMSGMYYTTKWDKIGLVLPKYFYGTDYKKGMFAPYVNPQNPAITKSLPPCYLMTSQADFLRRYTLHFAKALKKQGIDYALADYPRDKTLVHAFSTLYPEWEKSQDANQKMIEFLLNY